jgi:glucokinase
MILAGDIGGTKTNVALLETNGSDTGSVVRQQTFPSARYDSLEAILKEFIGTSEMNVTGACFGIAAPVIEGNARTPNLNWTVKSESLARLLKIERCGLINDLRATAYGIPTLKASLLTLGVGVSDMMHRALGRGRVEWPASSTTKATIILFRQRGGTLTTHRRTKKKSICCVT